MDFPCASGKLGLEMQRRLDSGPEEEKRFCPGSADRSVCVCVLSQLCRGLRRGALSAPGPEMVGAAPRGPRAAAEHHGGGRLRGGPGPAAAAGAVGRPLPQVRPSVHRTFSPQPLPGEPLPP